MTTQLDEGKLAVEVACALARLSEPLSAEAYSVTSSGFLQPGLPPQMVFSLLRWAAIKRRNAHGRNGERYAKSVTQAAVKTHQVQSSTEHSGLLA